jgi:hypothetical protein
MTTLVVKSVAPIGAPPTECSRRIQGRQHLHLIAVRFDQRDWTSRVFGSPLTHPATIQRYRTYVTRDIDPVLGSIPISAVTETTVALDQAVRRRLHVRYPSK